VASLVLAALSESAPRNAAVSSSSPLVVSRLACALERLDFDEEPALCHRAAILAVCSRQLADFATGGNPPSSQAFTDVSGPAVSAATAAEPLATAASIAAASISPVAVHKVSTGPHVMADPSKEKAELCLPKQRSSEALENPWFAQFEASSGKWRCALCAEAGGKNPYARGISMNASLVAMRMRIHAKAAIHQQAGERRQKNIDEALQKKRKADGHSSPQKRIAPVGRPLTQPAAHDAGTSSPAALASTAAAVIDAGSNSAAGGKGLEPWQQPSALCMPLRLHKVAHVGGA